MWQCGIQKFKLSSPKNEPPALKELRDNCRKENVHCEAENYQEFIFSITMI